MNTGNKIFLLRSKAGCSAKALAQRLNVSEDTVNDWENERSVPDSEDVIALSNVFGISTDVLLKDSEPVPENVSFGSPVPVSSGYEDNAGSVSEDTGEFILPPEALISSKETNDTQSSYSSDKSEIKSSSKKKKHLLRRMLALIAVIASGTAFLATGGIDKAMDYITEDFVKYPYILVHGLGGWGTQSKMNSVADYWGASTGSLPKHLNSMGYTVYEATVGPFSSAWDRACELYAQIVGTTVDYGEAHSKQHGHDRYGREYKRAIFSDWGTKTPGGQINKINLVGHSFGGPTIRLLTHLLANGAPEEISATGKENSSPLFTGGKGDWVNSVTTLCSPNNGSTLYYVLDTIDLPSLLLKVFSAIAGLDSENMNMLDFQLDHFGLEYKSDKPLELLENVFSKGTDNASFDLSPEGAEKLNERIELVPNVYYFSYSFSTTHEGKVLGNHVPDSGTLAVLKLTSMLMGAYKSEETSDGRVIDKSWQENDGLVNVVSARYPFDEDWQELDENNIIKGKWNVAPTGKGDHGNIIGLNADETETHNFYESLFEMIDSRPREKERYYALPGKEKQQKTIEL